MQMNDRDQIDQTDDHSFPISNPEQVLTSEALAIIVGGRVSVRRPFNQDLSRWDVSQAHIE